MTESVTLSELTQLIRSAIYGNFPDSIWVVAEISELNVNKSGHCYMELAEKDLYGNRIIARLKGMIWANLFRNIKPYFERTTGYSFSAGIKIMMLAQVEFHEVYGLSLNIRDVDPSYTLGDIARRKQETINRLKTEGVFEMNKSTHLPIVPQRIAIISSESAAGYGDFMNSLEENSHGISFFTRLFPAIMQGNKSGESIIDALDNIFGQMNNFDVVVLIRGGGAQAELDCFNDYDLSFYITQFPLPVITGIGHERDETVADLVAHTSLKTPTAVAGYLISKAEEFLGHLSGFSERLCTETLALINQRRDELKFSSVQLAMRIKQTLSIQSNHLNRLGQAVSSETAYFSGSKLMEIERLRKNLSLSTTFRLQAKHTALDILQTDLHKSFKRYVVKKSDDIYAAIRNLQYLDPVNILKRGFTITSRKGKILKEPGNIKSGEIIETSFYQGKIISRVEDVTETKEVFLSLEKP